MEQPDQISETYTERPIDLPENAHIDDQGRILVPRKETRSDKRLRQHFERLRGTKIDIYEIRGRIDLDSLE